MNDISFHNGTLLPPNVLDFSDLAPIERPVKLPWEGKPADFVLREASHATVRHYRGQAMRGAELTFNDDGERTIRNLNTSGELDTWLISECLFRVDGDRRTKATVAFIAELPERAVSQLLEALQEMTPSLSTREDLPSLRKQLAKLQDKIAKLERQEQDPKKLQSSGTES